MDYNYLNSKGFVISEKVFDENSILSLNDMASKLPPFVGMLRNFNWIDNGEVKAAGKDAVNFDWAYYWSQIPEDNTYINDTIFPLLENVCNRVFQSNYWGWQSTNRYIISNCKHNCPVRVHLDAPYVWPQKPELRMDNYLKKGPLSITFMVPLIDFTHKNGSTGYVPSTHKYKYNPKDMLRPNGEPSPYDRFFEDNYVQEKVECGRFTCFYGNTMHSVMPNKSDVVRRSIILRAIRQDALDEMNKLGLG